MILGCGCAVAFKLYDLDGDGFVSADEIAKVPHASYIFCSQRKCNSW